MTLATARYRKKGPFGLVTGHRFPIRFRVFRQGCFVFASTRNVCVSLQVRRLPDPAKVTFIDRRA